jgi:hypothetical protein
VEIRKGKQDGKRKGKRQTRKRRKKTNKKRMTKKKRKQTNSSRKSALAESFCTMDTSSATICGVCGRMLPLHSQLI